MSRRAARMVASIALLFAPSAVAGQGAPPMVVPGDSAARSDTVVARANDQHRIPALVLVNDEEVDRRRTSQLSGGVGPGQSMLMRSASSLTPPVAVRGWWNASVIAPQVLVVTNSALPFSQNDGALWAGKGISTRTILGLKLAAARLQVILAPEIIFSANADWPLREDFYVPEVPPVPSGRGARGFVLPYYFWTFPVDQPMRFGESRIRKFDFGQSAAMISAQGVDLGIANENEWWGPGIRNAIILSNNAAGFPHLFIRTARPRQTRFGGLEARLLVGGLEESRYFDTVATNNLRSISSIAATLQTRWNPNFSVGFARSVYATASGWEQIPGRWLHAVVPSNSPAPAPPTDSTLSENGRDHIFSLFARWVFPAEGFEVYGEWARRRFPKSLGDFATAPNHTQAYTIGAQWIGANWGNGAFRLQTEVTQLEQSATFRNERLGSWYSSPTVTQGYTHRGEVLGAAIGPGASGQWVAVDYLRTSSRLGVFLGRIRWNEDVHSTYGFPDYVAYCSHDVSLYPGIRGAKQGSFGSVSAELSFQNRMNAFFQNGGGCPNNGRRLDIRNKTLSITFTPFRGR